MVLDSSSEFSVSTIPLPTVPMHFQDLLVFCNVLSSHISFYLTFSSLSIPAFNFLTAFISFRLCPSSVSRRNSDSLTQLLLIHNQFFSFCSSTVFIKPCIYWPAAGLLLSNSEGLLTMHTGTLMCHSNFKFLF